MKEKKTKSQNTILMLIAIILIILTTVFSSIGYYAWAKYTTSKPGEAIAQVAKWHFELKPGTVNETEYTNFAFTRTDGYGNVVIDQLAPGTYGVIPIEIDTTKTEVTMMYDIRVQIKNCPTNLKFYTKANPIENPTNAVELTKESESVVENGETINVDVLTISKYLSLDEVEESNGTKHTEVDAIHNETIYWIWPYETFGDDGTGGISSANGDKQDTNDQGKTVEIKITATGTEVLERPSLKVGDLTKENAAEHYGEIVDYSVAPDGKTTVWRLFYIDFDDPDGDGMGKYGDKVGTIYLKADYNSSRQRRLTDYCYSYSNSVDTKVEEMNPLWAEKRASASWNANEKAAAYLCDTRQWAAFVEDSKYASYVNYAIGSPSVEMYIDSYNAYYEKHEGGNGNILEYLYQTHWDPGYGYKVNGTAQNSGHYTNSETLNLNAMYNSSVQWGCWWLASPSSYDKDIVCRVDVLNLGLLCEYLNNYYGVCPIVSIKPGSPVEFK